jgi:hypothetical protein
MAFLLQISERAGLSRVYAYLSCISYRHRKLGLTSPCDDIRVRMFMKGLKRSLSKKQVKRALPLTMEILEKAVQHLENDDSIIVWRTVWRMVITFSCFLKWDDISKLKVI